MYNFSNNNPKKIINEEKKPRNEPLIGNVAQQLILRRIHSDWHHCHKFIIFPIPLCSGILLHFILTLHQLKCQYNTELYLVKRLSRMYNTSVAK